VRDLFRTARRNAPCIIFIDEIDAVGRQRGAGMGGGNDEREQTLNQLLVEMDGFSPDTNIIVVAATNRVDILDQALLRPGRFDRQVTLDQPDVAGRLAILRVHARGKPLAPTVSLEALARQTVGFCGADLANMLNEAAILAARAARSTVVQDDLEEAILRVVAGPERRSRVISEREKAVIAYHEVGHALVMRSLPQADPVTKVSVIARGRALGITVQAPAEDRYLHTRSHLMARIAAAMGGRVAEELIFGEITTGAQQDIDQATGIAWRMVTEFGMSPLGTLNLRRRNDSGVPEQMSDALAARIDEAVALLVSEGYQTARSALLRQRSKLVEVSEHLMRVETIDGEELDQMLGTHTPAPSAAPVPLVVAPQPALPATRRRRPALGALRGALRPLGQGVAAVAWTAGLFVGVLRLAFRAATLLTAPGRAGRRSAQPSGVLLDSALSVSSAAGVHAEPPRSPSATSIPR
jgi:cell division protease FtsH